MTMTKRDLVIRVMDKLGVYRSDVSRIADTTFKVLAEALAEGKRWELRNFGVFEVKLRATRVGRNPRTGESVPVPSRWVITFRPGKKMRETVARAASDNDDPETRA